MITSIEIENLRGIREGALERLAPLVVLVGPNGAGKSTILDALLIGASLRPAASAGYAVERRSELRYGARWLLYRGGEGRGRIALSFSGGTTRGCGLSWSDTSGITPALHQQLEARGAEGPYSRIQVTTEPSTIGPRTCVFAADNDYEANDDSTQASDGPMAWLVDARHGRPLHDLYSLLSEQGRRQALLDLVTPLIPGLRLIEVLTEHGSPRLNLTFDDRSIPVALAGDGVQALVRLGMELSTRQGSVLLEEPEAHQHPAAIRASAGAIAAGVRAGRQVVLTTHSLELVDALLDALGGQALPLLVLYRLKLDGGRLLTSRIEGPDVRHRLEKSGAWRSVTHLLAG